jgi:hypothetical protein
MIPHLIFAAMLELGATQALAQTPNSPLRVE